MLHFARVSMRMKNSKFISASGAHAGFFGILKTATRAYHIEYLLKVSFGSFLTSWECLPLSLFKVT